MSDTGNTFGDTLTRSVICDSDLSAKANYLVTIDSTDDNVVNLAAAATAPQYVLLEGKDGSTTAQAGLIAYGGRAKVILGGTVNPGVPVMSDGNGKAITATNGKYAAGIAVKGGVSGDIVEIICTPGQVWTTVS
jgi:hypothetical protein